MKKFDVKKYRKKYYQKNKKEMDKKSTEYRLKHPEKHKQYSKSYRDRNKEKRKIACLNWTKNNPEKRRKIENKYRKNRWKIDKNFNIKIKLRNRLNFILNKYLKTGKIMSSRKYVINYKKIIEHLKPFPKNLKKFEIDHIRPLCSFNFVNKDGSTNLEEVRNAFLPSNHQWLTAKENMSKGGRI